jgi:PAS domain S-box-containing protein
VAMGSERPDAEAPGIVLTLFGQVTGAVESCGGVSVLAADLCGAVTLWSDGARRLYGFDGTEIVGQPLSLLDVDGSAQGMWERTRRLGSWEGPVQRVRKDGSRFTARVSATPVLGADGNPEGYVFVPSDVNDEAMLRRELEDERRYERSLFDASGDAMVMVDDAGVIRRANEASERTFGYGHVELVGQPVEMLLPARDRADHPERRASFSSRPCGRAMAAGADFAGLRKDGVEITLEITLTRTRARPVRWSRPRCVTSPTVGGPPTYGRP